MSSYRTFQAEYRRYVILKILADAPANSANSDLLQMALCDLGYTTSYKDVLNDLNFLQKYELLRLEKIGELSVATLTRAGGDIAACRTSFNGIRKPLSGLI